MTPLEHAHMLSTFSAEEVTNICKLGSSARKGRLTGQKLINMIHALPILGAVISVHPINQSMIKLQVALTCQFEWNFKYHGGSQSFWLLIEDSENERIYHHDNILINKRSSETTIHAEISLPVLPPIPAEYYLRIISDSWVGCESLIQIPLENIKFPSYRPTFTSIIDQSLVPTDAVGEPFSQIYSELTSFNRLQTQLFDSLFKRDDNILIAAPNGSGKGICMQLAILRLKKSRPKATCVYIAPLNALVNKTFKKWKHLFRCLPWKVVKLNRNNNINLEKFDIVLSTAADWDAYIRETGSTVKVGLVVLDAIHLIGEERGALMESVVTRIRCNSLNPQTRILALSQTLAGPLDFAEWIGADKVYNFPLSSRPVRIDPHIQAFPGRHFIPRMSMMNKAIYSSLKSYARESGKQVTIFVNSRAQSRSTALELISHAASDGTMEQDPVSFLNCREHHLENILQTISDKVLKHSLSFGIGLIHNSLSFSDKETVQKMHSRAEIKVLVATIDSMWSTNYSSVVIIKGTERYDSVTRRYVDYPFSDVMEMFYRAGRPGSDSTGVAIMMVGEDKKPFYKRRLEENGLPVESYILGNLCNVFNTETSTGGFLYKTDAFQWMKMSFAWRRILQNPDFYEVGRNTAESFIDSLVVDTLDQLQANKCITIDDDGLISPCILGQVASKFSLDYSTPNVLKNTMEKIHEQLRSRWTIENSGNFDESDLSNNMQNAVIGSILFALTGTQSFAEVPIRFSDDEYILSLAHLMPWGFHEPDMDKPSRQSKRNVESLSYIHSHSKSYLLIQAHIFQGQLPTRELTNDMAFCVRISKQLINAMIYLYDGHTTGPEVTFIQRQLKATKDTIDQRQISYR